MEVLNGPEASMIQEPYYSAFPIFKPANLPSILQNKALNSSFLFFPTQKPLPVSVLFKSPHMSFQTN
jgi:hypothetical protein